MRTMSPRAENERMQATTRPAVRSAWDAVTQAVTDALQRLMPERWVMDVLVLAFALFLVGATALYGLAAASKWAPPQNPPGAARLVRGDQEPGAGALNVCSDLVRNQVHSQDMQ